MWLRDLEEQRDKSQENLTDELRVLSYILRESKVLDGGMIILVFNKKLLEELREKFPGVAIYP